MSKADVHQKLDLAQDSKGVPTLHQFQDLPTIPYHEETPVRVTGIISSPAEFYSKRKSTEQFTPENSYVTFSKNNLTIELFLRERDHFKDVIKGQLKRHKFLLGLGINEDRPYTIEALKKAFQRARMWFKDPAQHTALMSGIRNFSTKIELAQQESNDRQGNKQSMFKAKVKEGSETFKIDFVLSAPIFEGMKKEDIRITSEIDFNDATSAVQIFLVNDDLDLIIDNIITDVWLDQKEVFADLPIIDLD